MPQPDLPAFLAELGGIPATTDPILVRQRSRDMSSAFSPVLKREARDRSADAILDPRTREEVVRIAAAAARHRVPLIARGGGSANFGQAIPLQGGAVLDLTALSRVLWVREGRVRAECGARLIDIDAATKPGGWELRMHPSTAAPAPSAAISAAAMPASEAAPTASCAIPATSSACRCSAWRRSPASSSCAART